MNRIVPFIVLSLLIINRVLRTKLTPVKLTKGSTVLISGASSGLGRALAIQMSLKGATVHLVARNESELEITRSMMQSPEVHSVFVADLSSPSDAIRLEKHYEGTTFDLVVSCAGVGQSAKTAPLAQIYQLYSVNVSGAIALLTAVKSGAQLLVSSPQAYFAVPNRCFYASSKAAVSHYAKCARLDGANTFLCSPGWFESSLRKNAIGGNGNKLKKGKTAEQVAESLIYGLENGVEETEFGLKERVGRVFQALFGDIVQYVVKKYVVGKQ